MVSGKLYVVQFSRSRVCRLFRQPIYFSTSDSFCQPFFSGFLKVFFMAFLLFGFAMPSLPHSFQEFSAPSPECLTIISYHPPIVNYFFRIFSFFRYFLFLYREFYAISLHFPSFFRFLIVYSSFLLVPGGTSVQRR